ncbi:DUF2690 domain-containing protein [Streptomyces sp. DW26H14]|uniref:DUF2690 domain-containing protein n=1 Tax=Streptomyces sp. DW26H14 TaxID=3435395 RepID=UPI00403DFDAD
MTEPPQLACEQLAEALRELKTRTGVSMAALADRTAYSKSSWQRYLNGKQLAPRKAVDALCTLAKEPPGRLLALWELADQEWSRRAQAVTRPTTPGRAGERTSTRRNTADRSETGQAKKWKPGRCGWAFAAAVAVGLVAAAWVTILPGAEDTQKSAHSAPSATLGCHNHTCTGQDPMMMGCAASGQVEDMGSTDPYHTSTDALLAFRYSRQCHAAWAMLWQAHLGDVLELSAPGEASQRVKVADSDEADGSVMTPMIDGTDLTRLQACYESVGGRSPECFPLGQGRMSSPAPACRRSTRVMPSSSSGTSCATATERRPR